MIIINVKKIEKYLREPKLLEYKWGAWEDDIREKAAIQGWEDGEEWFEIPSHFSKTGRPKNVKVLVDTENETITILD